MTYRCKSLQHRMRQRRKKLREVTKVDRKLDILTEFVRELKISKYPYGAINIDCYARRHRCVITVHCFSAEMVIDLLAGPLHQQFDILWTMNAEDWNKTIVLTGDAKLLQTQKYLHLEVKIVIHEEEMKSCEIIRITERIRSEEEMEEYRIVTKNVLQCSEAT